MKLITENWAGVKNEEEVLPEPSFSDVKGALGQLDGRVHTLLSLELQSGAALQVGGGPDRYISQSLNGDSCWLALGAKDAQGIIELVVGGQASEFETAASLTRHQAFDVLSVFFHGNGVLSTNAEWKIVY